VISLSKYKKEKELVDFNKDQFTIANNDYRLASVVNHHGSMDSGHYLTLSRYPDGFYSFNDENVQLYASPVVSRHNYVLFFTKL
jgi:ubiquitin C-terminal hydrolase